MINLLLAAKRDMTAATCFSGKAMEASGDPGKVARDTSGANNAAINAINASCNVSVAARQVKHVKNTAWQGHRATKRVTKPMLVFKSFQSAAQVIAGADLMRMIVRPSSPSKASMPFAN